MNSKNQNDVGTTKLWANRKPLSIAVGLALGLVTCIPVANAADADYEIEEVIVTAERREANLQEVPIAISSFTADQLSAGQVETIGDLQSVVPNLSIHVGDANNAVAYIRGIGQIDSIAFFEPGVGIYLDDVYMGRAQGAFLDVVDVERIEVLRGPQGSLYGRNTVGGAIKYISKGAGDELSGKIETSLGNFERRDIKATVAGPISDNIGGRLTLAKLSHEGYSENQFDGKRDGDRDVSFARGLLDISLTDTLSAQFSLDYSDGSPERSRTPAKETPITLTIIDPYTFAASEQTFAKDSDPFKVNADFNNTEKTKTQGYNFNLTWDVTDEITLKSISSYRELEYGTEIDLDGTPLNAFGIFYFNDQEQVSQELQLNYNGDQLSIVSGLYYYKEEGDTFDGGIFNNFLIASSGEAQFETRSTAVFGQLDYDFTEDLTASFGFRYTEEEKDYSRIVEDFNLTVLAGITPDPITGAISYQNPRLLNPSSSDLSLGGVGVARPAANPETAKFDNFSPKFGLKYRINDQTNIYGSVSTGFKSGGFNGRLADGQLDPFDEETLTSIEFGIKTILLDNRLRLNTAFFHNRYEDLQVSSFAAKAGGGLLPVFSNAGEAEMQGFEIEMMALLTDSLTLNFNVGYLDAEYKEFLAGADAANNQVLDLSDQREMVNAPKWDTFVGLTYDTEFGDYGSLSYSVDGSYRAKTYLEVNSSEVLAQGGYSTFNAAVRFESNDEHWTVMLGGKNLSDKQYRTHAFDVSAFPGVQLGYYNPPRTYHLTAAYKF